MDISSIGQLGSANLQSGSMVGVSGKNGGSDDLFGSLLTSAMDNIKETNSYAQKATEEKIKLALGETESTHDLTIALQKSATALQYTVAVRDKFLEAYKEIINMQI